MTNEKLKQAALIAYRDRGNSKLQAVRVISNETKLPLAVCKELAEKWIDELEGKGYILLQEQNRILTEALEKINSVIDNSQRNIDDDLLYEIKYIALTTLKQTKN